ncbi:MAG: UDP-N-acetylglucosamine 1-carboxyvinyltransferase, partial [Phascolarctobacterium sp.]|nr:UDP-N-acetylglucosamine 1-carboxyvinyltransferase [Phascolarctobacterium sp.]
MEKLIVKGGKRLVGTVKTSGAKNAVLPIIAASIMGVTPSHFDEVPMLEDVRTISEVLKSLGIKVESKEKNVLDIDSTTINSYEPPCELMRNMRASFFIMGPLLARMGKARIHMPGGCAIGARPVDIHLKGFEALGVVLKQEDGFIEATTPNGLKGATIYFDFPSVGATENVMMAAALAEGVTILENAAEEPEIVALANYLNKMGAKVRGAGTDVIRIEGVKELRGADYTIIPDRIEAGTYMIAAAMTGGDVIIDNVLPEHQKPLIAKLREAGAIVEEDIDKVRVIGTGSLKGVSVKTLPYPGFPTDMQAQIMA